DYAEALEDSVVCFIDTEKLKHWMSDNHDLRMKIRTHIGERLRRVENRLLSMIFKDARTRVHDFLVDFVKEFGTYNGENYEVKNFLTNDEVAKLTATSRQTVNAILNELRDKNIIEYNKDVLIVPQSSPLFRDN
ncbi:MAG: Crp/Fnr family transcriptional regulator, partial [Chitinophagaceae bacterium]|nr:Crp/Fnr family transcriptional regulator [Chitinophagaceae bacterium]